MNDLMKQLKAQIIHFNILLRLKMLHDPRWFINWEMKNSFVTEYFLRLADRNKLEWRWWNVNNLVVFRRQSWAVRIAQKRF